ncbi:bcl-2-like protein 1 [Patella vulgata]|uniref:bcl-2-like protein 1 n=1 Tax=Patella vulgata TaxID=6465 RepID=UPI0021802B7C|nr:bcl-2-like protein 1 [Patella vulgata]
MNGEMSRHIVEDYVSYRLSKNGYRWINGPVIEGGPSKICSTMRSLGDEFEDRYRNQFDDMVNQLDITPDIAYQTFKAVVNELFIDGVNWGRIVALFAFGGSICVQCVEKNMPRVVDNIVDWVATYCDNDLRQWINSHNSWQGFVAFYEKEPARRNENPWSSFRKICGYAAGALGVLTLGAILTQKS